MIQSGEMQGLLSMWREKAKAGTLTKEEAREAIIALREGRVKAISTGVASKARAKKPAVNSDDLLSELDSL